jgi:hypothetical protein
LAAHYRHGTVKIPVELQLALAGADDGCISSSWQNPFEGGDGGEHKAFEP